MKLEDIGFYTLSNLRASQTSETSPMWRCEMILTNKCNFKCPYCRGLSVIKEDCTKDIDFDLACFVLNNWINDGLKNVRFSGGEPTLYKSLNKLVLICKGKVDRIAVSSNGSRPFYVYEKLINSGVNDFSISLDACCASFGDKMAGVVGQFNNVVENIRELSKLVYVTVGVVLTKDNVSDVNNIIQFAHSLGVADIRIISAAQYNEVVSNLDVPDDILEAHPILKYRIKNFKSGRNVRGIKQTDSHKCSLVQDDSVVAGKWHFPCVIYMREGGSPIGEVNDNMRRDRIAWMNTHNTFNDPICKKNCLDVCVDYNNACSNS